MASCDPVSRPARGRARVALLVFPLIACAPRREPPPAPESVAELAPDRALHAIVLGWWPARIRRDVDYFGRLLAPEFVWRRSEFTGSDMGRRQFLEQVRAGWYCGAGTTYQYRIINYRTIDGHVVVNSASTVWVGDPIGAQHQIELLQIFRRRPPAGWHLVEAREVSYQVEPASWEPPDTAVVPWSWRAPTNPADLPHRLEYPCAPRIGVDVTPGL